MKILGSLLLAWAMQRSDAREVFQIAPHARTQSERLRRLALANGLGSAKQTGLTIPPDVLARADRVIR